jgi:ubiquinone/menaquinone biosynthesis C-methylase UbiE
MGRPEYVLSPTQDELERLIAYSEREAHQVEFTARTVGLREGASALDVGCGPLGALPTLSKMVGPSGRVVGVDSSEVAVNTAVLLKTRLGLENVSIVRGDLNDLDSGVSPLDQRFDLIYCRLVLLHQPSPRAALASLARLVRKGGFIAYQDILDDPSFPRCEPPVEAMSRAWELILALLRAKGACPDVARDHARMADELGWTVVAQRGKFPVLPASEGFQIIQQLLDASAAALATAGLATADDVRTLVSDLQKARSGTYRYWYGHLAVETIVQVGKEGSDS